MARIYSNGFEFGDMIQITNYSGAVLSTSVKRSGAYSLSLPASNSTVYAKKVFTGLSELYFRYGIYIEDYDTGESYSVYWINGATILGGITVDGASHTLSAYVGGVKVATGTHTLSSSTWYLIEVHLVISDTGDIEVKLDGILDIDYSGDTQPAALTTIDTLYWISAAAYGHVFHQYIDDIAINNTTGSNDNSWPGDGKIILLMPNGTYSHQLTPSDGTTGTTNHLMVDEIPKDDDTTYVEGSVVDEEDIYELAACGLSNVNINSVWAEGRSKDTVADGGLVALTVVPDGGAPSVGNDISLVTSYTVDVWTPHLYVNPVDSAAWEVSDIDALKVGVRTRS